MCGRIFQSLPLARLLQIAKTSNCKNGEQHTSNYNVCPTTYIPVLKPNRFYMQQNNIKEQEIADSDMELQNNRELQFMRWGHKGKFNMVINGRIEEMLEKRMFLNNIKNRCVVIMEGYYEWNSKKQPFSLKPKDTDHFMVAALYTEEQQIIILTKDATPELSSIHHRMPVFLSHQDVNIWMNPKNTIQIRNIINKSILKKDKQVWKNVGFAKLGPHVSNIKEKSSKCLMTIEDYKKELDKTGLMKFWKKPPAIEKVTVAKKQQIKKTSYQKLDKSQDKSQTQNKEKKQDKIQDEEIQNKIQDEKKQNQ